MHPFVKQFLGNLPNIVYLRHADDSEPSKMRVYKYRLWVCVANDTQSCVAGEIVQFALKA